MQIYAFNAYIQLDVIMAKIRGCFFAKKAPESALLTLIKNDKKKIEEAILFELIIKIAELSYKNLVKQNPRFCGDRCLF